ncbi:MAG: SoxR reducing system RseC family protein [Bacteroidales bacterium]|nr:SoxR reducing system RseC family protein [Bacteroidales bacterium]
MGEVISHKGTVTGCGGGKVSVEIVSESACAACHAAGLCTLSESSRKIIEVPLSEGETYVTGQEVEVCLARKSGLKAVLFSYVIPVMFLLILILSLSNIGLGELAVGLLSVGGIALYYLVLYLFRGKLAEGYGFYIKK